MEAHNKDKYFKSDKILNAINKLFVSLQDYEKKEINQNLHQVIDEIIEKMKEDTFFKKVFQRKLFGGSFYKGTKIGVPEEFDIDIIIKLPINYEDIKISICEHKGFINIHSGLNPNNLINPKMDREVLKLLDNSMYIDQNKFRSWMESIVTITIHNLPKKGNKYLLKINNTEYMIRVIKSGPAFTFEIEFMNGKKINVDLVPVLEFSKNIPHMSNLSEFKILKKQNWFAIPKPITINKQKHICWRTCFYEQEKEILSKNGQIKQIIRLMKKLRDTKNWNNIASYYIETIALNLLQKDSLFGKGSCTLSFMKMLRSMHSTLIHQCLPYYWNNDFNLLYKLNLIEIRNISNQLRRIIEHIDRSIENDPYIIAKCILNEEEYNQLYFELNKPPSETENNENSICMII
ncbi:hypothetical protein HZH66_008171 [Vespula vulgaris]|uniref:Cyclic GMP-AMP synthase n=2 Tax=Vespula vulgaris TaxID=7454 RepID=A0A834N3K2_VESVU|nr:cyclic GMP-AMP synthase-like receptor isoform X1 [Vespula vulgaris]KAF7394997.1 hypothetical protein HZH66_008171 [Vespula vulgaris]